MVYPFLYSTNDEQQYNQLLTLFDVVTRMETPILMGDFNNGPVPRGSNVTWKLPFHYGLINARGFVSPYVLQDGRCTLCVDNPSAFPRSKNLVPDHIYVTAASYRGRVIFAMV